MLTTTNSSKLVLALVGLAPAAAHPAQLEGGVEAAWNVSDQRFGTLSSDVVDAVAAGGRWIVAVERDDDRPALVAFDVVSGALRWEMDYPDVDPAGNDVTIDLAADPTGGDVFLLVHRNDVSLEGEPEALEVLRVRGADGAVRWSTRFEPAGGEDLRPEALAVDPSGQRVIAIVGLDPAGDEEAVTLAFSAANGALLWSDEAAVDGDLSPRAVEIAPDGQRVLVGCTRSAPSNFGADLRALDLATGATLWATLASQPRTIDDLAVSSDGRVAIVGRAASGSLNAIAAFAAGDGALQWSAGLPTRFEPLVEFAPDGARLFTSGRLPVGSGFDQWTAALSPVDGGLQWESQYDSPSGGMFQDDQEVRSLEVSPDGSLVLTAHAGIGGNALVARLLASATGAEAWVAIEDSLDRDARLAAFDESGTRVLAAGSGLVPGNSVVGTLSTSRAAVDGALLWSNSIGQSGPVDSDVEALVTDTIGERLFAVESAAGRLLVCRRLADGEQSWAVALPPPHSGSTKLAATADGSRVYVTGQDNVGLRVAAHRGFDGLELWSVTLPDLAGATGLALDPTGSRLFVATSTLTAPLVFEPTDIEVVALDGVSGATLWTDSFDGGFSDQGRDVIVAPDGQRLVVAGLIQVQIGTLPDGTPQLRERVIARAHDAATGAPLWTTDIGLADPGFPIGTSLPIGDLAVTPDGQRVFVVGSLNSGLFTNDAETSVAALDLATGALLWSAIGDDGIPISVRAWEFASVSADGTRLTVAGNGSGDDPIAAAFDASSGALLWERTFDAVNFDAATSDPAGSRLVVAAGVLPEPFPGFSFFGARRLFGVDAADGALLWQALDFVDPARVVGANERVVWDDTRARVVVTSNPGDLGDPTSARYDAFDEPPLTGLPAVVALGNGGEQRLGLRVGSALAGGTYLVLGSISGTAPGLDLGGLVLPLVPDAYTSLTAIDPAGGPLTDAVGQLDAGGAASASFALPAGSAPSLAGTTVHHAFVALELLAGVPSLASVSNALPVQLVP